MSSSCNILQTDIYLTNRPGAFVTSEKGKKLQQQVWGEIVEGLSRKVPAARELSS